jgi:hypothetical protein
MPLPDPIIEVLTVFRPLFTAPMRACRRNSTVPLHIGHRRLSRSCGLDLFRHDLNSANQDFTIYSVTY